MRSELEPGEQCLDAVRFLTRPMPSGANPVLGGAHQVVIQAAIGLLPGWARDMLGLRLPSLAQQAVVGPAAVVLMGTLRLTGEPPPITQARARCAQVPSG
jgi:uncharacterized protein (DUF2236 family)